MKRLALILTLSLALAGAAAADALAKPKPRFAVTKLAKPPSTAKPGDAFKVSGRIANRGRRRGRARVRVTLRESKRAPAAAKLLRTRKLPVKPHRKRRFSGSAKIPARLFGTDYRLVACVRKRGGRGPRRCRAAGRIAIDSGFEPGAMTLGDPLLPQIGNGGYDARHYDIRLDYRRGRNRFRSATTAMTAVATQNLSRFSLDFQDLPIDAVRVDGRPASFSQVDAKPPIAGDPSATQPMKLVVTPRFGIPVGAEFEVEVAYHGRPRVITDPDGSIEGWIPACYQVAGAETCDSNYVVGQPLGSQAWFPSNNFPSDKASFRTSVTVRGGDQAFGVGELVRRPVPKPDGTVTWTWSEDVPTATYLVTASNGDFDYTETTATDPVSGRTIPVYNAIDPSTTALQRTDYQTLTGRDSALLGFLGERFGRFPFDSYGAIYDRTEGIGYALEVQTKAHFPTPPAGSAAAGGSASVYLHELAHMWFGDAVSPRNWNDIWFAEAWASFAGIEYGFAFAGGSTTPAQAFDQVYGDPGLDWSLAPAVLGGDPANLFDVDATYRRPGAMIEGLREILGDARFFDFARALGVRYAYGNISTADFIDFAKEFSGFGGPELTRLDAYLRQWLYGTERPTLTPGDF